MVNINTIVNILIHILLANGIASKSVSLIFVQKDRRFMLVIR